MWQIAIIDDDIYIGEMLQQKKPDLILLDLMLPGLSGEEVLPHLQGIPVIVVSAKVDVQDKVSVLMSGAADYVTKPFQIRELLARIYVQLHRPSISELSPVLEFEELRLDTASHTLQCRGEEVRLTKTEYAILKLLMQNPNQVIAKSVILDQISLDTPDCTDSSLKQHISNLRKKLRETSGQEYLEAVWGIGFKLSKS